LSEDQVAALTSLRGVPERISAEDAQEEQRKRA